MDFSSIFLKQGQTLKVFHGQSCSSATFVTGDVYSRETQAQPLLRDAVCIQNCQSETRPTLPVLSC